MKYRLLLYFITFVGILSLFPAPSLAFCNKHSAIFGCPWSTSQCAAPMDWICCTDASECAAQNPFCGGSPGTGIRTGLGCVQTQDSKLFINQLVAWAVSLAGLAAFGLIIYSGFTMITAQGDAKRVKSSQEILTAAVMGLILILSAVVVLNFIGIRFLHLDFIGFSI